MKPFELSTGPMSGGNGLKGVLSGSQSNVSGSRVVVIPAHLADEIADEAHEMTAFEDFVTERVQEGQSILGLYPPTDERNRDAFAVWRKAKGR